MGKFIKIVLIVFIFLSANRNSATVYFDYFLNQEQVAETHHCHSENDCSGICVCTHCDQPMIFFSKPVLFIDTALIQPVPDYIRVHLASISLFIWHPPQMV